MNPARRALLFTIAAALASGVLPSGALACGYCVEDKIAAVYDHALITRSAAQQHTVVFLALLGEIVPSETTRRALTASAEAIPGVDSGSVRVSVETGSLALAFDPRQTSLARIEQALSRKLAAQRLSVGILRSL